MRWIVTGLLLLTAAGLAAGAWLAEASYSEGLTQEVDPHRADWVTSDTCRSCHQDHYASWHRTYHRTMTQEATPSTVEGAFDGRRVTYWGQTIRPVREGDNFYFEYLDPQTGEVDKRLPILRTIGSHRYQQYLTQFPAGGETYYRLHMLWHIKDQRWVHMNGVFLGPDDQTFDNHFAVWNHNCIFCHNTGPEPGVVNYQQLTRRAAAGESVNSQLQAKYDSEVAELGIACETCHGPGEEHARKNRNPLRRYWLHWTDAEDPTIVDPKDLSKTRQVQVCGQCHGQRVPETAKHLLEWITTGPTYRAGDDLEAHVNPIWRDSRLPNQPDPDMFKLRFWPDGTPRLSAYEYQGLNMSECYTEGQATCITCHSAHGGDPDGMIPAENRGNKPCLACHEQIASNVTGHTKHAEDSSGSRCYSCHMPRMIYGVMTIHRSHHIERPDPGKNAADGRPNACNTCHNDRSVEWAAKQARRLWGDDLTSVTQRKDGAPVEVAGAVASLHAGDPVQRAVAAQRAGRSDAANPPRERAFLVPHLLLAMERDDYPAVRRFAKKTLATVVAELAEAGIDTKMAPVLEKFDFIGPEEERRAVVDALWQRWEAVPRASLPEPPERTLVTASYMPDEEPTERLRALGRQRSKRISVGE